MTPQEYILSELQRLKDEADYHIAEATRAAQAIEALNTLASLMSRAKAAEAALDVKAELDAISGRVQ